MLTDLSLRELYGADFEDLTLTETAGRAPKPRRQAGKKSLEAYAA